MEARDAALLDAAARLFLEQGYAGTTLEAVVQAAAISKRTLYQRFPDKPLLFAAVLAHVIDGLRPPQGVPLIEGPDLASILERLGGFMLAAALQPQALALHRLVTAESARFPEIGRMLAANPLVRLSTSLVADQLTHCSPAEAEFLATQFLVLVVTHPQRAAAGLAPAMGAEELRQWPRRCVALFLHGVAGLPAAGTTVSD